MNFSIFDTAYAQEAAAAATKQPSMMELMIMPLGFLMIMYFFIIRPQAKKAKDQAALIKALKPGQEVITSGGIIGRIKAVADTFVTVEIAGGSLKVAKEHISAHTAKAQKPAQANTKTAPAK